MVAEESPLARVAFAKTAAHGRFVQGFEGRAKGRHVIAYLAGVGMLGGQDLVGSIKRDLGNPTYLPDAMYPGRDLAVICDRAARAGLSLRRLGEIILPSLRRANPEIFERKTIAEAFEVLEQASRRDTSYYENETWPAPQLAPGRAVVFRPGRPTPCETFEGILLGLLKTFGVEGSVKETECLWKGSPYCAFEARWSE